jgi:hypothetical protein
VLVGVLLLGQHVDELRAGSATRRPGAAVPYRRLARIPTLSPELTLSAARRLGRQARTLRDAAPFVAAQDRSSVKGAAGCR